MNQATIKQALVTTATVLISIYLMRQFRATRDIVDRALIG